MHWPAPTNSPRIAPSRLNTTAISKPAKMKGRAFGNCIFQNICQREAESERMRSIWSDAADLSPTMVFTRSGKNATRPARNIFDFTS